MATLRGGKRNIEVEDDETSSPKKTMKRGSKGTSTSVFLVILIGFAVFVAIQRNKRFMLSVNSMMTQRLPSGFHKAKFQINKSKKYDLCTIGAGLSGTVFAERTANVLGKTVLVLDNRPHIGGNCYDYVDRETGVLRNLYGAHLFHTNVERVWEYINMHKKAPKWLRWDHQVIGHVDDKYVPIPVNINTVNSLMGFNIKTEEEMMEWLKSVQVPCPEGGCKNAEQMAKSRVGDKLYEAIFRHYTIKQWDLEPSQLDALVTARIPVRSTFDPRYFADKYQVLPSKGYTAWFAALLDHPKIDVVLGVDFFHHREHLEQSCDKIIYTGPIDRYFEKSGLEKLQYRSIKFTEERHYDVGYMQPASVVNFPGPEVPFTRAVEYKHFLHQKTPHSIVVKETSSNEGDPYYPVPNDRNKNLYEKYKALAEEAEKGGKVQFVGRLANYKYFNMDAAIDNALQLWEDSQK